MSTSSYYKKNTSFFPGSAFGIAPARDASAVGRANRSTVLRATRWHGPVSRRQLSEITGLGSATVFSIVDELTTMGLLADDGIGESTGGRKPTLYRFNPEAFYAVGVDVGGMGHLRTALTDLDGNVLSRVISQIPVDALPDLLIERIATATDQAIMEAGVEKKNIKGVGVAMNGKTVPLAQMITDEIGITGYVVNHSNAIPLGEKWCGAGRDLETFVCVNVGVNVGAGMILDGKLYTGSTHLAGQLGHTVVDENGPLCWCGKHGCMGTIAGGDAIAKRVIRDIRLGASSSICSLVNGRLDLVRPAVIAQAAAAGDPYAVQVVQDVGRYLGIGVALLNNLFNPQAVMVGGSIVQAGDVLFQAIRQAAAARAVRELADVPIMPVGLGVEARAVGAAIVVLERQLTL
jgi:predicted NBD/HSP70 family sugar kinase